MYTWKRYKRDVTILEGKKEVFRLNVIRPSLEAWKEIEVWAQRICDGMNAEALVK